MGLLSQSFTLWAHSTDGRVSISESAAPRRKSAPSATLPPQKQPCIEGNLEVTLTGATLGFFFGLGTMAIFGPAAQYFKTGLTLSLTQVSFLIAIPALSGPLVGIPLSVWAGTNGGRRPFLNYPRPLPRWGGRTGCCRQPCTKRKP